MSGDGPGAGYLALAASGELARRAAALEALLRDCTLCPRRCRVDRRRELGSCATGIDPVVAAFHPHFGEERVISGRHGSGTVFLANCNLACVFCQNHEISQRPAAFRRAAMTTAELARAFLALQAQGCHNLNWVSPTHQVPALVRALALAAEQGLEIPVVYNTNGYDSVEVLRLLDGLVDVYMPDLKYSDPEVGRELSGVADYPQRAREALTEIFRQVGDDWVLGPDGELRRGLLVRILVLPEGLAGVEESLRWLAGSLSPRIAVSLLAQYRPAHRVSASSFPALARSLSDREWQSAAAALRRPMSGDRHQVQGPPRFAY